MKRSCFLFPSPPIFTNSLSPTFIFLLESLTLNSVLQFWEWNAPSSLLNSLTDFVISLYQAQFILYSKHASLPFWQAVANCLTSWPEQFFPGLMPSSSRKATAAFWDAIATELEALRSSASWQNRLLCFISDHIAHTEALTSSEEGCATEQSSAMS